MIKRKCGLEKVTKFPVCGFFEFIMGKLFPDFEWKIRSKKKKPYSETSAEYIQNRVPIFDIDRKRYERSKRKETEFNENWMKQKMNLNELVDKYAPKASLILKSKDRRKCDCRKPYSRLYRNRMYIRKHPQYSARARSANQRNCFR